MSKLDPLFAELEQTPKGTFFNPWFQHDHKYDISEDAPDIRQRQLRIYLQERLGKARYLCIAEAIGYQGGHFSGVAMTSERILLGHHEKVHGISSRSVFRSLQPRRTSKPKVNANGMTEPTATIMWKAIKNLAIDPYEVVLWNALAWHPYDSTKGMLSNRTPSDAELEAGQPALKAFLELFPGANVIAVGRKCEQCLDAFGVSYTPVRHPANGGAPKFRKQFRKIIQVG
jgi:hypothetical protein